MGFLDLIQGLINSYNPSGQSDYDPVYSNGSSFAQAPGASSSISGKAGAKTKGTPAQAGSFGDLISSITGGAKSKTGFSSEPELYSPAQQEATIFAEDQEQEPKTFKKASGSEQKKDTNKPNWTDYWSPGEGTQSDLLMEYLNQGRGAQEEETPEDRARQRMSNIVEYENAIPYKDKKYIQDKKDRANQLNKLNNIGTTDKMYAEWLLGPESDQAFDGISSGGGKIPEKGTETSIFGIDPKLLRRGVGEQAKDVAEDAIEALSNGFNYVAPPNLDSIPESSFASINVNPSMAMGSADEKEEGTDTTQPKKTTNNIDYVTPPNVDTLPDWYSTTLGASPTSAINTIASATGVSPKDLTDKKIAGAMPGTRLNSTQMKEFDTFYNSDAGQRWKDKWAQTYGDLIYDPKYAYSYIRTLNDRDLWGDLFSLGEEGLGVEGWRDRLIGSGIDPDDPEALDKLMQLMFVDNVMHASDAFRDEQDWNKWGELDAQDALINYLYDKLGFNFNADIYNSLKNRTGVDYTDKFTAADLSAFYGLMRLQDEINQQNLNMSQSDVIDYINGLLKPTGEALELGLVGDYYGDASDRNAEVTYKPSMLFSENGATQINPYMYGNGEALLDNRMIDKALEIANSYSGGGKVGTRSR